MKRALLYVALAAALVQVGVARSEAPASQAASKTATPADEVKLMEKRYTDALMKKDLAALEKIWSHDYTFTNGQGRLLSRAERLENVRTGATETQADDRRGSPVRARCA